MDTILVTIFAMAYAAIALEHPLKVNKSASALLGAGLLWTVYAVQGNSDVVGEELSESLSQIAQIIFFLMGAMTIVEVIDAHNGFALVTSRIRTTKLARLLWIVGLAHLLPQCRPRQPDNYHHHGVTHEEVAPRPRRPTLLCRDHSDCGKCGRRMVSDWRRDHHDALDRWPNYRQSDHWSDIRSGTLQSARAACSDELGIKRKAGHPSEGADGSIKWMEHNAIRTKYYLLYGNCGVADSAGVQGGDSPAALHGDTS